MSYKVGDKVRVREDLIGGKKYGRQLFDKRMEQYKGRTAKITEVVTVGYFIDDFKGWIWTDEMLLPYESTKSKPILKDGMMVELANGSRAVIINGMLIGREGAFTAIGDIDDDSMENRYGYHKYDINKVFYVNWAASVLGSIFNKSNNCNITLLWERNPKRMTHAEIEKALGYEFTYVGNRHINDLWKIFEE